MTGRTGGRGGHRGGRGGPTGGRGDGPATITITPAELTAAIAQAVATYAALQNLASQPPSGVMAANSLTPEHTIWPTCKFQGQAVKQGHLPNNDSSSSRTDKGKRKWDGDNSKNQAFQPPSKQQKLGTQRGYQGKQPKCNRCHHHHRGACDSPVRCLRCGKVGHFAKRCRATYPQNQHPQAKAPRGCFNCDQPGHWKKDCPIELQAKHQAKPQQTQQQDETLKGCSECGKPGHSQRECPQLRNKDNQEGNQSGEGENAIVLGTAAIKLEDDVDTGMFPLKQQPYD